ncbi:MAG: YceI family protein [Myxococcales bacterium]|nr:YceI family protein [Myxococcales bacterium]
MRLIKPLLAFALLSLPFMAHAGDFEGQFKFTSKAPKEDIFGTAPGKAALTGDAKDLTTLKGTISVPVAGMQTGNAMRDDHLRSATWLDAAQFAEITFTVKSVAVAKSEDKGKFIEAELKVTGDFTLHGVTKEITAPATIKIKPDGKAKITTDFTIALADYKVEGKAGVVGDKVGTSIACGATLTGSL